MFPPESMKKDKNVKYVGWKLRCRNRDGWIKRRAVTSLRLFATSSRACLKEDEEPWTEEDWNERMVQQEEAKKKAQRIELPKVGIASAEGGVGMAQNHEAATVERH